MELPDGVAGFVPMEAGDFHLSDGFYFRREGDEIVITDRLGVEHQVRADLSSWASVLAFTSTAGETYDKHREALAFLG